VCVGVCVACVCVVCMCVVYVCLCVCGVCGALVRSEQEPEVSI